MRRYFIAKPRFRKHLIALAVNISLLPLAAHGLDLAEGPPGSSTPFIAPNVIISIDDSGSMRRRIDSTAEGIESRKVPKDAEGNWHSDARRIEILRYALLNIFDPEFKPENDPTRDPTDTGNRHFDPELVGDKKIRLAWQAMWNAGNSPGVGSAITYTFPGYSGSYTSKSGANSVDSATYGINSMQLLGKKRTGNITHRDDFINFIKNLSTDSGTPSHKMLAMADNYMRRALNKNSPWASDPGTKGAPYLSCRRNYHIFLTDGRWNGAVSTNAGTLVGENDRDDRTNLTLPDGQKYGGSTLAERQKTALYRDSHNTNLADWAFKSWANPLQKNIDLHIGIREDGSPKNLKSHEKAIDPILYDRETGIPAPATESFGNDFNGNIAQLDRYWNPKYDPATWPHMNTYTIGFSFEATTWDGFQTTNSNGICIRNTNSICPPTDTVPFGYDGSFPDLVTGAVNWPNLNPGLVDTRTDTGGRRSLDLWHAAINGRGRFYAVNKANELEMAFRDIFSQIQVDTEADHSSSATSGHNITRGGINRFVSRYEPKESWKGYIQSYTITSIESEEDENIELTEFSDGWEGKTTSDLLDAREHTTRNILTSSDLRTETGALKGGVRFNWSDNENFLSQSQKDWLKKNIDGSSGTEDQGKDRLNYIRGDRSKEGSDGYTSSHPYRERTSKQGDIVNSIVWYTGRPSDTYALKGYATFVRDQKNREPMIYVGGNDGMLHGFSASTGEEKIAYVPKGVIPKLRFLTSPDYNSNHRYFVDGSPMTGDIDINSNNPNATTTDWRTVLVGTLGLGGKGYFVLDVTDPSFSQAPENIVLIDRSASELDAQLNCDQLSGDSHSKCILEKDEQADIGHITAQPVLDDANPLRTTQITRMNNNRWAVVLGNGYNSKNQRPVLLIQYLDGSHELVRIPAALNDETGNQNAMDNGLAAPRLIDLNGDGRVDIAYAGDNLGNMWKFDLSSASDSNWAVAFNGEPLFTARGPIEYSSGSDSNRNKIQPITAAPTVRVNDRIAQVDEDGTTSRFAVGGLMVAFGTGRNIADNDPESIDVQSIYSVLDNTRYKIVDTDFGKGVEIITESSGECNPTPKIDCIPAPKSLGAGPEDAKLARQEFKIPENTDAISQIQPTVELDKYTWGAGYNGWYLDLPELGERLLKPMSLYDGSNILSIYTQTPAKGKDMDPNIGETCEIPQTTAEQQWLTMINILDGKKPTIQIIDYNGDGFYNSEDKHAIRIAVSKGSHNQIVKGNRVLDINVENEVELELARLPEESTRPSWRQVR